MIFRFFSSLVLAFAGTILVGQTHWESLVSAGDSWSYFIGDQSPASNWYIKDFDASTWSVAPGSFGYGDDDDNTQLQIDHSLYIVRHFQVSDLSLIDSLLLDIDYDDAWVAWLNGVAIGHSFNVDTDLPAYNYTPSIDKEAALPYGARPERIQVPLSLLEEGANTLAIQGINMGPGSSDFSLAPWLQVKINSEQQIYGELPDWFKDPDDVLESHLPLIVITSERDVPPPWESKIDAHMGIVRGYSGTNTYPGIFNNYDGAIGIKMRGSSSYWMFDKKGFTLETRNEDGSNNNVSILNLPIENDWVLHGPFSDKSLVRNALAYDLAGKMGQYAPRTRFCELILNGEYLGLYVLTEKVKQDDYRVNISKLTPEETGAEDITGGYILRIDRIDEHYWVSDYPSLANNALYISYYDPDPALMPQIQKNYIYNFMDDFEYALYGPDYQHPEEGYQPYVDLKSFVDFMLVNEFSKNVDAYRLSTYFYKDKDRDGQVSPLVAGPVWDFNLGFGNADYGDAQYYDGWEFDLAGGDYSAPFWWKKMKSDPTFHNLLVDSWKQYRNSFLSDAAISSTIDSLVEVVGAAAERNFEVFPVLGRYIWPNNFVGASWESEISYLKNWTAQRMAWMDGQLNSYLEPYGTGMEPVQQWQASVYPNPVEDVLNIILPEPETKPIQIEICNILGKVNFSYSIPTGSRRIELGPDLIEKAMPEKGIYLLNLRSGNALLESIKLVKQ